MRRTLSLLLVLCAAAMISGCNSKSQRTAFTLEQEGVAIKMVVDAKGDRITKLTQTSSVSVKGLDETQLASIQGELDEMKSTYSGYEGAKYSYELNGDKLKETIEIDTTDEDTLKKLSDAELLPIEGNAAKLSLKDTESALTDAGWSVEKEEQT